MTRFWLLAVAAAIALGCGDDSSDSGGADAAQGGSDGAVADAGDTADAALPDAATSECAAQQIEGCPQPCALEVGAYWDGESCQPILCCCEGPDCAETYDTIGDCVVARASCPGPQDVGEVCGQSAGGLSCTAGLACCYPCGIPGCEFVCSEPCESGNPGCDDSSGCALVP